MASRAIPASGGRTAAPPSEALPEDVAAILDDPQTWSDAFELACEPLQTPPGGSHEAALETRIAALEDRIATLRTTRDELRDTVDARLRRLSTSVSEALAEVDERRVQAITTYENTLFPWWSRKELGRLRSALERAEANATGQDRRARAAKQEVQRINREVGALQWLEDFFEEKSQALPATDPERTTLRERVRGVLTHQVALYLDALTALNYRSLADVIDAVRGLQTQLADGAPPEVLRESLDALARQVAQGGQRSAQIKDEGEAFFGQANDRLAQLWADKRKLLSSSRGVGNGDDSMGLFMRGAQLDAPIREQQSAVRKHTAEVMEPNEKVIALLGWMDRTVHRARQSLDAERVSTIDVRLGLAAERYQAVQDQVLRMIEALEDVEAGGEEISGLRRELDGILEEVDARLQEIAARDGAMKAAVLHAMTAVLQGAGLGSIAGMMRTGVSVIQTLEEHGLERTLEDALGRALTSVAGSLALEATSSRQIKAFVKKIVGGLFAERAGDEILRRALVATATSSLPSPQREVAGVLLRLGSAESG